MRNSVYLMAKGTTTMDIAFRAKMSFGDDGMYEGRRNLGMITQVSLNLERFGNEDTLPEENAWAYVLN